VDVENFSIYSEKLENVFKKIEKVIKIHDHKIKALKLLQQNKFEALKKLNAESISL
jgi:hypothetical protein